MYCSAWATVMARADITAKASSRCSTGRRKSALAWRSEKPPRRRASSTWGGCLRSLSLLATALWLLPTFWAACSWLRPYNRMSRAKPSASSM